jgi:uncharacterized protein
VRIAITGASGLIGSALTASLRGDGHDVRRLVRRPPHADDEVRWDPTAGTVDLDGLTGTEAVVHLAGAGIGQRRWTGAYKRQLRDSRVRGTTTIATAVAALDPRPRVLVSASAIGIYGDTGDREVDEDSPAGAGFLADVVSAWEASAAPACAAGTRVVHPRTGLVLSRRGGALPRMLPIFRLGLGGPLGSGRQYWSFVSLVDEVRALRHLIDDERLSGPVNVTAPQPVTNAEMTRALASALHRPAVLPVPGLALRVVFGEFATDLLGGQRVRPTRLLSVGFRFSHPDVDSALRAALSG